MENLHGFNFTSEYLPANLLPLHQYPELQGYFGSFGAKFAVHSSTSDDSAIRRAPVAICFGCGGYINSLSDISSHPGRWTCSLCHHVNSGLNLTAHQKDFPELRQTSYRCVESEPAFNTPSISASNRLIAIGIDLLFIASTSGGGDSSLFDVLQDHLERISSLVPAAEDSVLATVQVIIYFFDESTIRLVRLGEKKFDPLTLDVLPIQQLSSSSYQWEGLLKRGLYSLSITAFLESILCVRKGLQSFLRFYSARFLASGVPVAAAQTTELSFTHLYAFFQRVQSIFSSVMELKLIIFTNQSISLYPSSSKSMRARRPSAAEQNRSESLELVNYLGYSFAKRIYSSVDYFFVGNDFLAVHELQPFLAMTHGQLIISESLDAHFSANLYQILSNYVRSALSLNFEGRKYFLDTKIEIRCNENIEFMSCFYLGGKEREVLQSLEETTGLLSQGRKRRKDSSIINDLITSHRRQDSLLGSFDSDQDLSFARSKRFPLLSSTHITASSLTTPPSGSKPFDPLYAFSQNANITEEEVEEQFILSRFIDFHHLQRSYENYLSYLHDQKIRNQREIYCIPVRTFYEKILEYYQLQSNHFFTLSVPATGFADTDTGSLACLFNIMDPSVIEADDEEQGNLIDKDTSWSDYLLNLSQVFSTMAKGTTISEPLGVDSTTTSVKNQQSEDKDKSKPRSKKIPDISDSLLSPSYGILQLTIKSEYLLLQSREKIKETKLKDWQLWTSLQVRYLVHHYHRTLQRAFFFSSLGEKVDEQGNDVVKQCRMRAVDNIDRSVQVLSKYWLVKNLPQDCVREFFHLLYFLREGGLLDGPSNNSEESHYQRYLLLCYSNSTVADMNLLRPKIWLDLSFLRLLLPQTHSKECDSQRFVEAPPDSLSLLPGTIALIDCGNVLIIRRSISPISFRLNEEFHQATALLPLHSFAKEIAARRSPVPRLLLLPQPQTPMDRLVYSRLSPNHSKVADFGSFSSQTVSESILCDFSRCYDGVEESIVTLVLKLYQTEDYQLLLQSIPITDQLSFSQYIKLRGSNKPVTNASTPIVPPISPLLSTASRHAIDSRVNETREKYLDVA